MLLRIPKIIRNLSYATETQIARMLQVDIATLQPMLALLLKKGLITQEKATFCNKKCTSCTPVIFRA